MVPQAPPSGDTPDEVNTDGTATRRKRILVLAAATLLLGSGGGLVAYSLTGDIPRGTLVLGVDLGGKSRVAAERILHERFDRRAGEGLALTVDGRGVTVAPGDIAMTLDVPATVDAAATGSARLFGARTVAPVVRLDPARLAAQLRMQVEPERITRVAPAIGYEGVTPKATYAKAGLDLDLEAAAATVRGTWLTGRTGVVALAELPAARTDQDVDAVRRGAATVAVAAPVTVTVTGKTMTLKPTAIAAALTFRGDPPTQTSPTQTSPTQTSPNQRTLNPVIDGEKLHAAAAEQFAEVETGAGKATIRIEKGKPVIVPGAGGRVVDLARLAADLLTVLPGPAPRTVAGTLVQKDPDDPAALGIKEKVSTFTTYFTGGAKSPRSQNIMTVAKAVNGAVVHPGETFSLNGHTGERDYDAGYHDAPVIVGGKLEPGVGGGASQFTTTLFNAAYYAGLQDVEHKPHSFYFSRYPAVIESTIFYPTLDLKFKNTTPYGILIQTSTTARSVTVTMWSTKLYEKVSTVRGPRRNITSPPTVYREPGPKCITSSGLPGFTQDAWRIIRKDGKEIKREKFTWRYDPEPRFVCGEEP
jgi:vancomycin resistance protein YoaR